MEIEFWNNPETGEPHIHDHGVTEEEVAEVLGGPRQDRPGHDGVTVALGPTLSGRFLKVVYRIREDGVWFVITAFDAPKASVRIYRRHNKKKR